jgi:hypothetical protein
LGLHVPAGGGFVPPPFFLSGGQRRPGPPNIVSKIDFIAC